MAGIIAKNYCDAIFEIAKEDNLLDAFLEQLKFVDTTMSDVGFYDVISHPKISRSKKKEMLEEAFGENLDTVLLNFLKLLIDKGHMNALNAIVKEYGKSYNVLHGIQVVYVWSATRLQEDEMKRLIETLEHKLHKTIQLKCRIDEELIAGLRIKINDKIIDNSARIRLTHLQKSAESSQSIRK